MKHKPFIITFAGPSGTSKTPIAMYLSYTFRLPVMQMDAIRMEVREDLLIANTNDPRVRAEFVRRAYERYQPLLKEGACFIDDSSADREWKQSPEHQYYQLERHGYDYFIISMDMSREFISKLHDANGSLTSDRLDAQLTDHRKFLELYSEDVAVHIGDVDFHDRIAICDRAVRAFLSSRET